MAQPNARQDAVAAFNALSERESWEQQCDPTLAFVHPDFPVMVAVWREQAGDKPMPPRSAMTPRALKGFLPRVAINERVSENPPRFTWRLMGTHITQILGERTGRYIEENAPPRQVARWSANLNLVLTLGTPMRFKGRALATNTTYLASELLFMPLSDEAGVPRFVMGFGHYAPEFLKRPEAAETAA